MVFTFWYMGLGVWNPLRIFLVVVEEITRRREEIIRAGREYMESMRKTDPIHANIMDSKRVHESE